MIRLSENDADVLKHVGVLMVCKILFISIYIYMCVCFAFVGLDSKNLQIFT